LFWAHIFPYVMKYLWCHYKLRRLEGRRSCDLSKIVIKVINRLASSWRELIELDGATQMLLLKRMWTTGWNFLSANLSVAPRTKNPKEKISQVGVVVVGSSERQRKRTD
jgi:hypothetical protein